MKNLAIIVSVIMTAGVIGYFFFVGQASPEMMLPLPITKEVEKEINYTASFEIYTNGTKRIFTDTKYHNLSRDVYITPADPGIIYVKKSDTTWGGFFETLPMELSKDCLVTGTKQTFCTNDRQKLSFFINGQEDPNALETEIKDTDHLRVEYK